MQKMKRGRNTGFTEIMRSQMNLKGNRKLEIRPSVVVAKNVKKKDLVFALLNREVIEAMWVDSLK